MPERGFVFCCFNQAYKFTPPVFDLWCRLLAAMPGSVLWLLCAEPAEGNLRGEALRRGISPERLVFAPDMGQSEHLGRLQLADLVLDTTPYGAHTTASDSLWAGVPIVTCAGETFPSRVAGSLLHAVGLPELITTSEEALFRRRSGAGDRGRPTGSLQGEARTQSADHAAVRCQSLHAGARGSLRNHVAASPRGRRARTHLDVGGVVGCTFIRQVASRAGCNREHLSD